MGDNLDDLSLVFAMDDGQPAAEPAPKAKKKRKRAAEEEEQQQPVGSDVAQWLRRQGGGPEALSRLEEACGGGSAPVKLLDALPKDRRAFHAEYGAGSVIVLCMSATRCLEVVRALKAKHRCAVAKLFAKHIKLKEQLAELAEETPAICVGTPHRVGELLDSIQKGGLRASNVRVLLIDGKPDVKSFTMLTHFEASKQLKGLMETHLLTSKAVAESALSVKVFEYDAPNVSSK